MVAPEVTGSHLLGYFSLRFRDCIYQIRPLDGFFAESLWKSPKLPGSGTWTGCQMTGNKMLTFSYGNNGYLTLSLCGARGELQGRLI